MLPDPNPLMVVYALLRSNLASFIRQCFRTLNPTSQFRDNWHILAIAWHLEQVRIGKIKRLIICMPPRSLKSISASVAFPAFIHGLDPSKLIIAVSYGQELSIKLHNDYRLILSSDWYKALFPRTRISQQKDTENEVVLTERGGRLATSINGVLTGRGADLIIIDDPLKPGDAMSEPKRRAVNDWFGSTLLSRLNDKASSAIVIVTQRVHADDLVGHVLETSGEDWTVLELPAIATESQTIQIGDNKIYRRSADELLHADRESLQILDELRRDIGSYAFEAQYQQRPVPPDGAMFKADWITHYDQLPSPDEGTFIIQSWDTASKTGPSNDWSVCTTWLVKKGHYYLVDVQRKKLDYPDLKALAIGLAQRYEPRVVLVEDTGVGIGLIAELKEAGIDAVAVKPEISKEARASVQSAKFESGRVLFPRSAPWLPDLRAELLAFPGSRHDDQVDSITQALGYERPPEAGVIHLRWPRRRRH